MNKREPVTITLGGLPFSKGGRNASYSDLENFTAATWGLIWERYLSPNGPVIGFGYDVDGYLRVSLWNGPSPPENASSVDSLHTMLDERAKEMGIENIPVKFMVFASPPRLVLDCDRLNPSDRTSCTQPPENCPEKVTSLDALTVALRDPGVIGLLKNKSIETIRFSKGTYADRNMNYTQMVFRTEDPDPDDCTLRRSWFRLTSRAGFMPPTRPTLRIFRATGEEPDDHQQNVSMSYPACGMSGGTRWLM